MNSRRLLVVDDDEDIGALICEIATDLGFDTRHAGGFAAFREIYASLKPTALFVDLQMPDADGIQILNELHRVRCGADIFLISGFDVRVLKSARDFGLSKGLRVREALTKPIDVELLEAQLETLASGAADLSVEELREAVAEGQLFARYQPKLKFGTGIGNDTVCGAEALIRWQHPALGEVTPDKFIAMAENEGLIGNMTEQLLSDVSRQIANWSRAGLQADVAINLSAVMLRDLDLPDRYADIVRHAGIEPQRIVIELTESAVMQNVMDASEILTRFRLKGFGLSIDDFGTGFSSLVELYRMPFNELKIDRTFVGRAPQDSEAATIVSVLCRLSHELGLSVCAEGVETPETLQYLRDLGCNSAQGYVIAKPLLAEEFAHRLGDQDAPRHRDRSPPLAEESPCRA